MTKKYEQIADVEIRKTEDPETFDLMATVGREGVMRREVRLGVAKFSISSGGWGVFPAPRLCLERFDISPSDVEQAFAAEVQALPEPARTQVVAAGGGVRDPILVHPSGKHLLVDYDREMFPFGTKHPRIADGYDLAVCLAQGTDVPEDYAGKIVAFAGKKAVRVADERERFVAEPAPHAPLALVPFYEVVAVFR